MKKLLLGDEAIAQGAIDAGLSGVYALIEAVAEISEFSAAVYRVGKQPLPHKSTDRLQQSILIIFAIYVFGGAAC